MYRLKGTASAAFYTPASFGKHEFGTVIGQSGTIPKTRWVRLSYILPTIQQVKSQKDTVLSLTTQSMCLFDYKH